MVGVLVLVAAIMLAATGQYPQPLFDIIVALNRWGLRYAHGRGRRAWRAHGHHQRVMT